MGGFICQALGIAFESARLVSIQLLMSGLKMGPLVSLYYVSWGRRRQNSGRADFFSSCSLHRSAPALT